MIAARDSPSPVHIKPDIVADRHRVVRIGLSAVGAACLVFFLSRLAITLRTGLSTPWWGNAAGFVAIATLYAWYRRAPQARSSGAAHGTALVATIALLLPVAYGMGSTIWWLSLVGFAMVLLGRPGEALVWGVGIPLIATACVLAEPYLRLPGAAGEPALEAALAKIVFVAILIGMSLAFRRAAEQRAQALYDSEEEVRRLKNEFEARALTGEDLASRRLQRLEHLNSVLRAVRNVSQLITREKDPARLVERACAMLVETRGYRGAWMGLSREEGPAPRWAEPSGGPLPDAFARLLDEGRWPPCKEQADRAVDVVPVDSLGTCAGCPLRDRHATPLAAVVAVRHGARAYGILGVSYPSPLAIDEEEKMLVAEVAEDLGYALFSIDTQVEQDKSLARQRESEARFRQVFDTAPVPLSFFPLDGSSMTVNRRFVDLFGYPADEIRNLDDWRQRAFPNPLHREAFGEWLREAFAAAGARGGSIGPVERRVTCADGRVLDGEMSGSRSGDTILVAFVDMTARKRAEEERGRVQATLAQSDRLASMGMLAAGVAHEINNPLAYVLCNLESLTRDLALLADAQRQRQQALDAGLLGVNLAARPGLEASAGLANDEQRQALGAEGFEDVLSRLREALAGTQQIRTISRSLGTFSRVERTKVSPIDIRVSLEHAVTMVQNEIKYRARIAKHFADVPLVLATDGKLAQVFLNLLLNAAHSIREGHVGENEIRVSTWAEGDRVCAEVSDTGEGIAPEHHARIFEPFFTTKGVGMGTGLGLSICRNIIEELGGELGFTSELGKGTRFVVRLPALPEDWDEHAEPPPEAAKGEAIRGRILVVEDDEALRRALARMMGGDHDLVVVASGEDAQTVLGRDKDFDVLLFDMMMPHMSGMELHAWLREQDPSLARRVVFMTGGAFTPASRDYMAQVENRCLEKPFDTAVIRATLGELVRAARAARPPRA